MHARFRLVAMVGVTLCAGALIAWQDQAAPTKVPPPQYKFTGPFTHDNLSIFLVHGEDRFKGRKYIMLAEALEKKLFVIYETQSVNELSMENLGSDEVLILSGDILKGGQQDRIAQFDQIVPAKSGKQPLTVFCVEHTAERWGRKPTEADKTFHSSPGQICTSALRLASRHEGAQGKVWDSVAKAQKDLSKNAMTDVKAKESDSSLALSLKVKEVQEAVAKYVAKLEPAFKDKNDVVGFAFAINGKVYAADIYGSPAMFEKVRPRLLHASAIEAFADLQKDKTFSAVSIQSLKDFLDEADKGKASAAKEVNPAIRASTTEGKGVLRFDSKDKKSEEQLRQNYLKK